jgi:hypothetical protein
MRRDSLALGVREKEGVGEAAPLGEPELLAEGLKPALALSLKEAEADPQGLLDWHVETEAEEVVDTLLLAL